MFSNICQALYGVIGGLTLLMLTTNCVAADEAPLFNGQGLTADCVSKTSDAEAKTIEIDGRQVIEVKTHHISEWPGIEIAAPGGNWNLSTRDYISVDIKNTGSEVVDVFCRVDNQGADGIKNCVTGQVTLKPDEQKTLQVKFQRKSIGNVRLFGLRGYPEGLGSEFGIDPAKINQLVIFVAKPSIDHSFTLGNLRTGGSYQPLPDELTKAKNFFPLIDTFGQYKHRDWPGKTHSLDEMQQRQVQEAVALAADTGPADWNQWGGWASGPKLEATGFFHPVKYQGKWWLVDPDGNLFFSNGIDCVRMLDSTPIEERDNWFEDFPGDKPEFAEFFTTGYALHGYYAGRNPKSYNFAATNLKRKYGADWSSEIGEVIHQRLRNWGLNTIGNWSDSAVYLMKKTPYTVCVGFSSPLLEGSQGYWGKFRDVFSPEFNANVMSAMQWQADKTANDPWCIGYFVDNEIAWNEDLSLALAALASPSTQPAKLAFLDDLKTKYNEITTLNQVWGTNFNSWEALLENTELPDVAKANDDLEAFSIRTAETYFKTISDAVHAVAPNNLYLGCRFAWVNPLAAKAAGKYCDVVSYNLYRRDIEGFEYPGGDMPMIIGEFHFGALDRGMFHTGLVPVEDQDERTYQYQEYLESVLRHPQFVGCHWFQYQDEPTTGRILDEENYQIGFIDICDTPYAETVKASREIGDSMYEYRMNN